MSAAYLTASEIHAKVDWPTVLANVGQVPTEFLNPKHRPAGLIPGTACPLCGDGGKGKKSDRFVFTNKDGKGLYCCRRCGAGDGFRLLMGVRGWDFKTACREVLRYYGLNEFGQRVDARSGEVGREAPNILKAVSMPSCAAQEEVSQPTSRVWRIRRGTCAVADCEPVVDYLTSRGLWPLPPACTLRAHPNVDYYDDGQRIGSFPVVVADVVDLAGELTTLHVTYVPGGRKLEAHEPRKQLSKLTGHNGCAVRLMPAAELMGIGEGIETCLSAAALDQIPVWAALNTALLAKFEPPPAVKRLRIYADRDEAGLIAACRLMERLQGRIAFELRLPQAPAKDFNDQLTTRLRAGDHNGNPR